MLKLPNYCEGLVFDRSDEDVLAWCRAVEATEQPGNTGVIGDTGTGKTVVALLRAWKTRTKTLFLVPQKFLATQHQESCFDVIWGRIPNRPDTLIITGDTAPTRRRELWQKARQSSVLVVFATPQTVLRDIERGICALTDFGLIVLDEVHRAQGVYAYVSIATMANQTGIEIMGLSASPGKTFWKVADLKARLGVDHLVPLMMDMPKKIEDLIKVEPDASIDELSEIFTDMLDDVARALSRLGFEVSPGRILTAKQLGCIQKEIKGAISQLKQSEHPDDSLYDVWLPASSLHAEYAKLVYLLNATTTDSYWAAEEFDKKLRQQANQGVQASQNIINNDGYKLAANIVADSPEHPKTMMALKLLCSMHAMEQTVLVFVATRVTAKRLAERLNEIGIAAAPFYGGPGKLKQQKQLVEQLKSGKLNVVVATSVAEEGVHIPAIDAVLHYAMPLTEVARIQGSGRTGRTRTGKVIFLAMERSSDIYLYFATKRGEQQMRETIYPRPPADPKRLPIYRRRRKQRDHLTLDLPFREEETAPST